MPPFLSSYLRLSPTTRMPSKRIIASYVLDWFIIVALAAAGGGLQFVKSTKRPFSLLDLSISYPLVPESISTTTLALVALVAPGVIITFVCLVMVPGPTIRRSLTRSQAWRRKAWECYAGLTGLALSVALAFFITQGLKTIFAKPRPHMLAICDPDLTDIAAHVVGGVGQDISAKWTLVNSSICRESPGSMLADAFRSFPSGHCSFSWSGLLYLSLFICAKFSIAIPYLPIEPMLPLRLDTYPEDTELLPLHRPAASSSGGRDSKTDEPPLSNSRPTESQSNNQLPLYNQAAAPPSYGLLLVLIPMGVATYIASTRYSEFWHFGFDVICGSLIGIATAYFSFRWYHLPISRGQGWAWGPRSRDRSFAIGVGVGKYVGPEGWYSVRNESSRNERSNA